MVLLRQVRIAGDLDPIRGDLAIPSAVILSLSIANLKARRTARGQYGQVGVEKTWTWTGFAISFSAARVGSLSPLSPLETSRMASTSVPNS